MINRRLNTSSLVTTESKIKASRVRFGILTLIFINVVINYMDRSNISIAAPLLSKDLELNSVQMGLILSAFGWAYALLQIPGGWLVDRVSPRVLYMITLGLWSFATLLQAAAKGFAGLFGLRLSLGVLEAPAYPTNNRIVTSLNTKELVRLAFIHQDNLLD